MQHRAPQPSASLRQKFGITLAPVFVFVLVCVARVVYVSLYGNPLPFWDQWDELDHQIRPWANGSWHFLQLFVPHNEHRIAFTRLVSFFLVSMNGWVFDNLVEAYFNTLVYALLWAMLFVFLTRGEGLRVRCWLIALVVIGFGVLPFDWENISVGFQNSFYALELIAVAVIAIAAYFATFAVGIGLLMALALASLFTMASGVLAAPAAGFAILLIMWRDARWRATAVVGLVAVAVALAGGLMLMHGITAGESLHAHSLVAFTAALRITMSWPIDRHGPSGWLFAAVLWGPSLIWLYVFGRTRNADTNEVFAASICAWVFLQCLAIAWSRGYDLTALTSRYTEITAIGITANIWLALKLCARRTRAIWPHAAPAAVLVMAWAPLANSAPRDLARLKDRQITTTIETRNVQRYFAGSPFPALPEGSQQLPYPVTSRLEQLLDNPEIARLLPTAVFPSPAPVRNARLSSAATSLQRTIRAWFPTRVWSANIEAPTSSVPSPLVRYDGTIPRSHSNPHCSLDAINGQSPAAASAVAIDTIVTFAGWAGNEAGRPMKNARLILRQANRTYAAPLQTGVKRQDVAKALGNPAMANSGFDVAVLIPRIPAGQYSLSLTSAAVPATTCRLRRVLTVK